MPKPSRSPAELRNMFGANLRILSRNYASISDLSRRLGINRTQLNRYLSGESFPRPDVLDRICSFFDVDARILLEPVEALTRNRLVLNSPFLADFLGKAALNLSDGLFPTGFYRFSRCSFLDSTLIIVGLLYVFRDGEMTFARGYEPREAMRQQGLPDCARAREFRGFVIRQEEGIGLVLSRHDAMTSSFNFLSRVPSYENNYWVGYITRTIRESVNVSRVTRVVYEHLGRDAGTVLAAARGTGFRTVDDLLPYHKRLLQIGTPFR